MTRAPARASARLRDLLEPSPTIAARCGIEHEYSIVSARGPVPFGSLVDRLALDGRRLDPADPNARRLSWGGVITVDGREAEVVTPPVAIAPGAATRAAAFAERGRVELDTALHDYDDDLRAVGYSTHLNVAVADRQSVRAGRLLLRHFSSSLMLLMDQPHSPGLLIRPRRGRLEIAGEYVAGEQLRAALTFATGAALASSAASARPWRRGTLPAGARAVVRAADQRYGWYVDRGAFGPDLYREGRDAPLALGHARVRAGELLVTHWRAIRELPIPFASAADLRLVDDIVAGARPLPLERPTTGVAAHPSDPARGLTPRARAGGSLVVEARLATWDATLFAVRTRGNAREVLVNVPDAQLERFLRLLDDGALDDLLRGALATAPAGRVLRGASDTSEPGIFDSVADPGRFAPAERDVATGRVGGGGGRAARRHKHDQRAAQPAPRRVPRSLVGAAVVAAVVIVGGVALAATRGHHHAAAAPATSAAPAVTAPPSAAAYSGTYAISTSAPETVVMSGLFAGHPVIQSAAGLTYAPIDASTPGVSQLPVGSVTFGCAGETCRVTAGDIGITGFELSKGTAVATTAPVLPIIGQCGVTVPTTAAGSGHAARVDVQQGSRATGAPARLGVALLYAWDRETTAGSNDSCRNVLIGSLTMTLTRVA